MRLQELFQADRDALLASLNRDRSPSAAQAVLEKEVDRLIYLAMDGCASKQERTAVECALESVKAALPLTDIVRDSHTWSREAAAPKKKTFSKRALILLIAGIALTLVGFLSLFLSWTGFLTPLTLVRALVPAALGMLAVFFAGALKDKGGPKNDSAVPLTRTEFLIDPEEVLRRFHTMTLLLDNMLKNARAREEVQAVQTAQASPGTKAETEFLSELLEKAYALGDEDKTEIASAIRYYLHTSGIEAVDYTGDNEALFEFLPGANTSTIRPALLRSGRVLQKGLAELRKDRTNG